MKRIAVVGRNFRPRNLQKLRDTAASCGFSVDFYAENMLSPELAAQYEVLYGLPTPKLLPLMTNLKWFHSAAAGVDAYVKEGLYVDPNAVLTNSAGAYGATISEHIIMVILMLLRQYPYFDEIVRARNWVQEVPMRSIAGSRITVLGTGDIGTTFAKKANALGAAHICGVRRSAKPAPDCYDKMVTYKELDSVLPDTEILVMALPGTSETVEILNRERIALLPPNAIVINVGRGSAIEQQALIDALNEQRIAGAALDVMVPEPLPKDHPLWSTKNLLLTPHCSGNFSLGLTEDINVDQFCENLVLYSRGEPLKHLVDRELGY